jgi:hypothetical protein
MDIQNNTLDTDMYYISLTPVAEIEEIPADGTSPISPDQDVPQSAKWSEDDDSEDGDGFEVPADDASQQ